MLLQTRCFIRLGRQPDTMVKSALLVVVIRASLMSTIKSGPRKRKPDPDCIPVWTVTICTIYQLSRVARGGENLILTICVLCECFLSSRKKRAWFSMYYPLDKDFNQERTFFISTTWTNLILFVFCDFRICLGWLHLIHLICSENKAILYQAMSDESLAGVGLFQFECTFWDLDKIRCQILQSSNPTNCFCISKKLTSFVENPWIRELILNIICLGTLSFNKNGIMSLYSYSIHYRYSLAKHRTPLGLFIQKL